MLKCMIFLLDSVDIILYGRNMVQLMLFVDWAIDKIVLFFVLLWD